MNTRKVIVVDDESAARKNLLKVIATFDELEVIAEAADGKTAIEKIRSLKPDIVFLDIEMPELGGFSVASATQDMNYHLVFLTAYDQYALEAFETNAIDYLMKPARPELVSRSIQKILRLEATKVVSPTINQGGKLVLADGSQNKVIDYKHLNYIETMGRYRCIHLTKSGHAHHNQSTIITSITLDDFAQRLAARDFFRLHRSYIVNLRNVIDITVQSRRHFVKLAQTDALIPISRSLLAETKKKIGESK